MSFAHPRMLSAIADLVRISTRFKPLVLIAFALATVAGGWFTATHVGINTDTTEMLSAKLDWRVAYKQYKDAFPYFADTIVIVVDAETPELATAAANQLSSRLADDAQHFSDVFHPQSLPFFAKNALLYQDTDALDSLTARIASSQAMLGSLAAEPGLTNLLVLLSQIGESETLPAGSETFLDSIADAIVETLDGDLTPLSWRELMFGQGQLNSKRVIFTVTPILDYSQVLPADAAISALRAHIEALQPDQADNLRIRLTGGAALSHDELSSVIRGAEEAAMLALLMVALCLLIGLRSLSLVVATLITLVAGLTLTATAAVLMVGTLNMISVAFAVLYVGLGVDFAVHIVLRYRELSNLADKTAAVEAATNHIGDSILVCAITTAIAFFAFIPTDYRGVAELGLISGVGMMVALVTSFTLLPALLALLPRPGAAPPPQPVGANERRSASGLILVVSATAALFAATALPKVEFDLNPLHLNDQAAESVQTLLEMAEQGNQPLHSVSILARDDGERRRLSAELAAADGVQSVTSIDDLVPPDQESRLSLIGDLYWTLGGPLAVGRRPPLETDAALNALQVLGRLTHDDPAATKLAAAAARLSNALSESDTKIRQRLLNSLDEKILRFFPSQIEQLNDALEADTVSRASLPAALTARWVSEENISRIEIAPRDNLDDNAALIEFVEQVRTITGNQLTGTPVINLEASRAVTGAFFQAFTTAAVLIGLLLFAVLRSVIQAAICLLPLLLAGMFTAALCVIGGYPFNFANIIALPLLLGIGVDSALHIVHRYKNPGDDERPLLRSSTSRAVLFSALTTTASFGNLALSPHAGTASMGLMLSIGLAMTLICTLIVLPAMLQRFVAVAR